MTRLGPDAIAYVLVGFCVVALAAGQLMFKIVSGRIDGLASLWGNYPSLALLGFAVGLYAVSTLAWVIALRRLPLSQAYLFMALGFVIVPVAAHITLGEQLGPRLLIGGCLIVAGIWLASS